VEVTCVKTARFPRGNLGPALGLPDGPLGVLLLNVWVAGFPRKNTVVGTLKKGLWIGGGGQSRKGTRGGIRKGVVGVNRAKTFVLLLKIPLSKRPRSMAQGARDFGKIRARAQPPEGRPPFFRVLWRRIFPILPACPICRWVFAVTALVGGRGKWLGRTTLLGLPGSIFVCPRNL